MQRGVVRDTRKLPVTVVQAETRIDQGPLWGKASASKGDKRDAGNLQVYLEVVGQSPIPFPSGCMPEELSGGEICVVMMGCRRKVQVREKH